MIPATLRGPAIRDIVNTTTGVKIPCIAARGLVFTAWVPSPEELTAINDGSPVWLVQRGPYIPEMTMRIAQEHDVIPHDLMKSAIKEAIPGGDEYEQAVQAWKPKPLDRYLGRALLAGAAAILVLAAVLLLRVLW